MVKLSIKSLLLLMLVTGLASCGSGGGGGGGNGVTALQYTGSTNPAALSTSNTVTVSKEAYSGGGTGTAIGGRNLTLGGGANQPRRPAMLAISGAVEKAVKKSGFTSGANSSRAVLQRSLTPDSTCVGGTGSGSFNLDFNVSTGSFTGSFTFNNFCSDGENLTGTIAASGQINVSTLELSNITMTFGHLKTVSSGISDTSSGTITYVYAGSNSTITMNLLLEESSTLKVYKIENYRITMFAGAWYTEITIQSGRFYIPEYGYVDVTTPTPLRYYNSEERPSGGVLIFTGSTGVKARFTAYNTTTYSVELDSNNDGFYDWDSGFLLWG